MGHVGQLVSEKNPGQFANLWGGKQKSTMPCLLWIEIYIISLSMCTNTNSHSCTVYLCKYLHIYIYIHIFKFHQFNDDVRKQKANGKADWKKGNNWRDINIWFLIMIMTMLLLMIYKGFNHAWHISLHHAYILDHTFSLSFLMYFCFKKASWDLIWRVEHVERCNCFYQEKNHAMSPPSTKTKPMVTSTCKLVWPWRCMKRG